MANILVSAPSNWFVSAMSVVSLVSLANAGFSEIRGKNMKYSKFFNSIENTNKKIEISGRNGMLIAYSPAFIAGVASFALSPDEGLRVLLVQSALSLHFFKRLLEVAFIHKYSGGMDLQTSIVISFSYFMSAATIIYAQHLAQGHPQPQIDLTYPGIVLFLIGISGNFYHHYLLSKLRANQDKQYKVPRGGFFDLVICPHYLFEIIGIWGVAFISQTLYSFSFALGTTLYLMGRSYATRRWYLSKFEDFPTRVKALIPFVF